MGRRIKVESKELERHLAEARRQVSEAGLPGLLCEVDRGAFGTTPLNLEALDCVAQGLAAALAAAEIPVSGTLQALYFGYLFAWEALDRLQGVGTQEASLPEAEAFPVGQYKDLPARRLPELFAGLLKDCGHFVRFYRQHPDASKRLARDAEALRCLRCYFRLLANTLRKLHPDAPEAEVETPRLRFSDWRVSPGEAFEPSGLLEVGFSDIVGNEPFVKAGRRLARDVAGFDLAKNANPKKVRNQILFVLGTPGCGKTVTAHAVLRDFLALCEKSRVPAKVRVIRRTDWASAYQNQSASRLLEIFRDEVFNAPSVVGVYWPDIDTAFAARGDSEIRLEEKANLGTLFGILDGTIGPKNGKWFLICDANTLHMDEATLSRISQSPLKVAGPSTPQDFVKLLRDVKLRGKGRWLPLSEAQWLVVGERCAAQGLSGRSADAVAGRILTEIEDFEEPEEYYGKSFEEKAKMIEELSRPVPAERLMALIADHVAFERGAQAKAEEERFQRRVDEIKLHLSAQRAALSDPKLFRERTEPARAGE